MREKSGAINRAARLLLAVALSIAGGPLAAATVTDPVGQWLDDAEAAEQAGHLIYPASGSATSLYHEVLSADPGNQHAIDGLSRIAEHYLEAAQQAMDRFSLLRADASLSRARMVYPDYLGIPAITEQLELLKRAERTRQTLDWRLVAKRSDSLRPVLLRLGSAARNQRCRVTIQVSNDAEGRWVYQQLKQSPGEGRIRAEVVIASPAAVEILCFNDA